MSANEFWFAVAGPPRRRAAPPNDEDVDEGSAVDACSMSTGGGAMGRGRRKSPGNVTAPQAGIGHTNRGRCGVVVVVTAPMPMPSSLGGTGNAAAAAPEDVAKKAQHSA
jgi:hypothetical protein